MVVDYAHKPAALTAVLANIAADTAGRLIVVIGAGGDRDAGKRPVMGQVAAELADLVLVTDDNPRSESPAAIRAAVLPVPTGARPEPAGNCAGPRDRRPPRGDPGRRRAAATPADAVVIAGKGHEQGQDVGDVVHPLLRREELTAALRELTGPARPEVSASGVEALTRRRMRAEQRFRGRRRGGRRTADARPAARRSDDRRFRSATGSGGPFDPAAAIVDSVEFDSRRCGPARSSWRCSRRPGRRARLRGGGRQPRVPSPSSASRRWRRRPGDGGGRCRCRARRTVHAGPARAVEAARAGGLTVVGYHRFRRKDLHQGPGRRRRKPASAGETVAPPESFNNELGHPYTVLRAIEDTRHLVLELSARGVGHIRYLAQIAPPRIGVVLNVGTAHLGEFGSVDGIAQAKGELVEALPAGVDGGVAILNSDDPRVAAMRSRTRARVVTVRHQRRRGHPGVGHRGGRALPGRASC